MLWFEKKRNCARNYVGLFCNRKRKSELITVRASKFWKKKASKFSVKSQYGIFSLFQLLKFNAWRWNYRYFFQNRRDHEEICPYKPVQCPEFDCTETRPMNEIFKHFRLEHHHHFVNAHGSIFNGDIRCDDSNMIMGKDVYILGHILS